MDSQTINELKLEIDSIKEYVYSDLCVKCREMAQRLEDCEKLLEKYKDECSRSLER